jgi:hypothetical protein
MPQDDDRRTAHLEVPTGNSISFNFATGAVTAASSKYECFVFRQDNFSQRNYSETSL